MKKILNKLTIKQAKKLITDTTLIHRIEENKEEGFILSRIKKRKVQTMDPLLDLEVSLHKCKRLGIFKK